MITKILNMEPDIFLISALIISVPIIGFIFLVIINSRTKKIIMQLDDIRDTCENNRKLLLSDKTKNSK
jgi:hypothetical protein